MNKNVPHETMHIWRIICHYLINKYVSLSIRKEIDLQSGWLDEVSFTPCAITRNYVMLKMSDWDLWNRIEITSTTHDILSGVFCTQNVVSYF